MDFSLWEKAHLDVRNHAEMKQWYEEQSFNIWWANIAVSISLSLLLPKPGSTAVLLQQKARGNNSAQLGPSHPLLSVPR